VLLYAGGYIAQFVGNYAMWQESGGAPGDGTSPDLPSASWVDCFAAVFTPPYGMYGILFAPDLPRC